MHLCAAGDVCYQGASYGGRKEFHTCLPGNVCAHVGVGGGLLGLHTKLHNSQIHANTADVIDISHNTAVHTQPSILFEII